MRLVPLTAADEALTVRLECDPQLMHALGGPRPEAEVRAAHQRRLALMARGAAWMSATRPRPRWARALQQLASRFARSGRMRARLRP